MNKRLLYAIIISFVILLFLTISKKIVVASTSCESQFGPCSEEIEDIIDRSIGQSYIDAKGSLGKALSESSRIEKYAVKFKVPSIVVVRVVEKKAEIALKFADHRYLTVDRKGNLIAEVDSTQLPTIEVTDTPNDHQIAYASDMFWNLFSYYGVTYAKLDKYSLRASVRGAGVIFPLEGDLDIIFGSLEVLLLQLNRVNENPTINSVGKYSIIDLRYKNPVISKNE